MDKQADIISNLDECLRRCNRVKELLFELTGNDGKNEAVVEKEGAKLDETMRKTYDLLQVLDDIEKLTRKATLYFGVE